jgi:aspartate/glutamate racemase
VLVQLDSAKVISHETQLPESIPSRLDRWQQKNSACEPQVKAWETAAAETVVLTNNTQPVSSLTGLEK